MSFFYGVGIVGALIVKYISDIYKKVVNGIIGFVGVSLGLKLGETANPEVLIFQSFLIALLIKVLGVLLLIYFRSFLVLVFNSFIGACLVVISFGRLTNQLMSLEELIERQKYQKDFQLGTAFKIQIIAILVLTLLSIVGQKIFRAEKKKDKLMDF